MDYNNMVSKEELVGQFALAGEKGASKEDVELIEAIAFMRNKAYEGGYRAAKKEVEEKVVAPIPQNEPVTQECAVKDVSFYECNGQRTVSSRDVAKNFEKEHKDVLDSIRLILAAENSATKSMFYETAFEIGNGETQESTRWTRKGQAFLYKKLKEAGYLPVNEQMQIAE